MAYSIRDVIDQCAKQFRFYEKNHRAKEPPDTIKADVNASYALMCEVSLQSISQESREHKYGLALLMIANGCDNAKDFATEILLDNGMELFFKNNS